MQKQVLFMLAIMLALVGCATATPTPTSIPPTTTPIPSTATPVPPTFTPTVTPTFTPTPRPAPTTEELLKIIADIPLDAYPFLKDKKFMDWLQNGEPTPTPTPPLPAGPVKITRTASDGTPYEFVYYPPKRAPALVLFVYFPIVHGLEQDGDLAPWLQYLGKQKISSVPYRLPGQTALLRQVEEGDRIAFLALNTYTGCTSPICKLDEMRRNEEKWAKDQSEIGKWIKSLLPGTDDRTQVTTIGKSLGGYLAMQFCLGIAGCSNVFANSPYIPSLSYEKVSQTARQLQTAQIRAIIYTFGQDPYLPPFQNVSGAPWTMYTVSGQGHGLDFSLLTTLPDLKNSLYNCVKTDTSKLQAELNPKKAELEKKRQELGEAQQKLDKLTRLLQDPRMRNLAQAAGAQFPLDKPNRDAILALASVTLRELLASRLSGSESKEEQDKVRMEAVEEAVLHGWNLVRETHEASAVQEFQNGVAKVLNGEADKVKKLDAQVKELAAQVQDLERQMDYSNAYCPPPNK